MPLRSGGRYSKAKRGEIDKIHALLPLLRPLLQSGSLRSVLETAAGSARSFGSSSWQGKFSDRNRRKRVRHSTRADVDQPPPRDTSPTRRMERESGARSRGIPPRQEGDPLGERGRGERVDGRDALRNGCTQSRQRFLHQLGDIPVQYQSTAPQGRSVKDGGTKQIVQSLSKQHTDKQGWEAAELAPRVAARRWLKHSEL